MEALDMQIITGNAFELYKIGNVPEEILAEAPSFNVVVGLALRDMVEK